VPNGLRLAGFCPHLRYVILKEVIEKLKGDKMKKGPKLHFHLPLTHRRLSG
jgi:hypothetical protein